MKKKRPPRRTPQEAAADALKVLRSKADVDGHWVSGAVGCATCAILDPDGDTWVMDASDVAAVFGLSEAAVAAGIAKAKAATVVAAVVVEQFPAIAEPEHEDLDSLGEQGQFSVRLRGEDEP